MKRIIAWILAVCVTAAFTGCGGAAREEETVMQKKSSGVVRVACVGDSLTEGIGASGWQNGDFSEAYPQQLQGILGDSCLVGNFGKGGAYAYYKSGRDSALWYPNTEQYAESNAFDADIVILLLGCNDIRVVNSEEQADLWKEQYTELVRHYMELDTRPTVYLVSTQPLELYDRYQTDKGTENFAPRDPAYRQYILPRQIAAAEELGCSFFDMYHDLYDEFMTGKYFGSDSLHPNSAGYAMMAEYFAQKIQPEIRLYYAD